MGVQNGHGNGDGRKKYTWVSIGLYISELMLRLSTATAISSKAHESMSVSRDDNVNDLAQFMNYCKLKALAQAGESGQ